MKKLLHINIRIYNCYRFQLGGTSNIYDYNYNFLKVGNCRDSLIKCNRSYSHWNWDNRNILTENAQRSLYLQNSASAVRNNVVRYKTTESATPISKAESAESKEAIKTIDVTPLTRGDKLKKAVKEYGATVIVFHIGISLISLGSCYLLVTSGLDVPKIFTALGFDEWASKSQIATSAGTFAVAYAIHKVFVPVRMAITMTSVPFIVRYLRKIGFLKK